MAHSLRFYGDGISFRVVFGQPFRVFPGGARIAQTRWMLARGILGSGRTRGVSFRPFRNSSSWWWLISSIFLIRISCHKITPANGYHGAWPGWVVSVSVLPLTRSLPRFNPWSGNRDPTSCVASRVNQNTKMMLTLWVTPSTCPEGE